jgi:hypothetical protein
MTKKPARYAATYENLIGHALEPAMRWLIATALDGATMAYGDLKHRLETEETFSTVFTTRIGFVAGELMNRIQEVEPAAPLINVLVVNQRDRQPSKGAGSFMATRFNDPLLKSENYKQRNSAKWKSYVERAAAQVYAYSPDEWSSLYQRVFGRRLTTGVIEKERKRRREGNEHDFGVGKGKYGAGGEGEHHKSLRLWVTANPQKVGRLFAGARTETESDLDSGDRVDAVYHLPDRTVVVEVKSRISNLIDLRRGAFQCIKYRAVKAAMDVRMDVSVQAILVTETKLPGEIAALLKRHDILHFEAPLTRS